MEWVKQRRQLMQKLPIAMGLFASSSAIAAEEGELQLNMTRGVTEISQQVYDLHMTILTICALIGAVVFGLMFWSMWRHRKSQGAEAASFHESTKVEILWTAIPFLILIGMAIPATKVLIAMEDTTDADLTVQVTGSQWKWHYRYFDQDVDYFSRLATLEQEIQGDINKRENYLLEVDRPLVIPVGQKVRFLFTSDDVIHSWWVPEFAVKKDANPGFINEAWTQVDEPGIYRGQCAELCGKDHGFMPIVVIAKEPAEYQTWLVNIQQEQSEARELEQQLLALDMSMQDLMAEGERAYLAYCAACHQPNGEGLAGAFPAIKGSDIAMGEQGEHIAVVYNGRSGTAMQAFAQQMTLSEIAAVLTYQRNAWGNNTGDVIQARDIKAWVDNQGQ